MVVKERQGAAGPVVLRGVLFTLRRKCGKPSCRCATGETRRCTTHASAGSSSL
jgi:hypothetical protein